MQWWRVAVVMALTIAGWAGVTGEVRASETQVDATVFTTNSSTEVGGPTAVWVSSSTAYAFYLGAEGDLEMASTTNAGTSWGVVSNVDSVDTTDVVNYAIWWDGWTQPGTSTEFIHIVLSWDNGTTTTSAKTTPTLTASDGVYTLGGESDTWGTSWTPFYFSNENFQVRVIAHPNSNTVRIDAIQVRPYHQATGGSSGGGDAI